MVEIEADMLEKIDQGQYSADLDENKHKKKAHEKADKKGTFNVIIFISYVAVQLKLHIS